MNAYENREVVVALEAANTNRPDPYSPSKEDHDDAYPV